MSDAAAAPAGVDSLWDGTPFKTYDPAALEHVGRAIAHLEAPPALDQYDEKGHSFNVAELNLAIEEWNQAIAIQPDAAEAYLLRGFLKGLVFAAQATELEWSKGAVSELDMERVNVEALGAFTHQLLAASPKTPFIPA